MIQTCTVVDKKEKEIFYDLTNSYQYIHKARLSGLTNSLWDSGDIITFAFMDGRKLIKNKVVEVFLEWTKYANITFEPALLTDAMIRISFKQEGSWSYLGKECLEIPKNEPTVNFGWLTTESKQLEIQRVVLHEFGHVLGMIHEHQNPNSDIPWNKDAIYEMYSGAPNYWNRQEIDTNFFEVYDKTMTNSSEFDRESIMLYPISNKMTYGDYEVGWNTSLSEMDKEWISSIYS